MVKRESEILIEEFLKQKKIAIVGVTETKTAPGCLVYDKMKSHGYQVYGVNPKYSTIKGDICYASLAEIPDSVDAVFVATKPEVSEKIIHECMELGISRVWMHNMTGTNPSRWGESTSVSADGVELAQKAGLQVIAGSCPMQFIEPDIFHRCLRFVTKVTGGLR